MLKETVWKMGNIYEAQEKKHDIIPMPGSGI